MRIENILSNIVLIANQAPFCVRPVSDYSAAGRGKSSVTRPRSILSEIRVHCSFTPGYPGRRSANQAIFRSRAPWNLHVSRVVDR